MIYFYRSTFKTMFGSKEEAYILKNGIPAEAIVKEVKDTGITINNGLYFMVDLVLEIKSGDRPVYQTETRVMVSRVNITQYQVGMAVQVKIHPEKQKKVQIIN